MTHNDTTKNRFLAGPILPPLLQFAFPLMLSQLLQAFYGGVDLMVVGQYASTASVSAVATGSQIMQALTVLVTGLTMGVTVLVGKAVGAGDRDAAGRVVAGQLRLFALLAAALTAGMLAFAPVIVQWMNVPAEAVPETLRYVRICSAGILFITAYNGISGVFRGLGNSRSPFLFVLIACLVNVVLDLVFVGALRMNASGAALATALSQCVSFCLLLAMFLSGKSQLHLSVRLIGRDLPGLKNILACGLPSFARQALASVATALLNWQAGQCGGDAAVAAMSVVGRIFMFVFAVMLGIGQGFQPVAGYNYGAGKFDRLRRAFRFTLLLGEGCICVVALGTFWAAPWLIQAFRNDPQVIEIGVLACRLQCCAMLLVPVGTCANMLFQSTGQSAAATFLSSLRQGLYYLPLMLVLPLVIGLRGVQIAQPLADALTFVTSVPFLLRFFAQLPRQDRE